MQQELVSVIMPTFNAGEYLSSSIESILAQTYTNFELLITDDNSSDNDTLQILKDYSERDSRIKIERLSKNSGTGVSRNNAIERAKGRYIAFCDCDDRWLPEKLEKQIAMMEEKQCALSCSSYLICDDNSRLIGINRSPSEITFDMERHDNKIGCLTAVYDITRLGRKFYMPQIRKRQDWGLFLSILRECNVCYSLAEPLAIYRHRQGSISHRKFSLVKYNIRIYHDILGYSWTKSLIHFLFLFLPSYGAKVIKRKIESYHFIKNLNRK